MKSVSAGKIFKRSMLTCTVVVAVSVASGCTTRTAFGHLSSDEKASDFNAELGTNYLAAGELENAENKLQRSLAQDPANALANNSYGKLLAKLDDPKGAERAFKKSIRLDPKRAEYRNNYAIFLCDNGRTAEAVDQFVAASENKFYLTPEYALDNAGVCAMDGEQYALADKHMRSAIRVNPRFAPSILHMAELKLKTGDASLADAYYSRFLTIARQTPHSLAVGIDIKRASGDAAMANDFARTLVANFPRSAQARAFVASN